MNQKFMNQSHSSRVSKKLILVTQAAVCVYTLSGVAAKFASTYAFLSIGFITCYACEMFILAVYAVVWQQIIKHMDISIAYANRALAIFWSMLWARFLFNEQVTLQNLMGVVLIFMGTMVVNSSE